MRKFFIIVMTVNLIMFGATLISAANTKRLHPRNKLLIEKGIIPPMKYFPEVPRVTALEAMTLYKRNKTFFIAIGHDAPKLPSGWVLHEYMAFDPARLKIPKGKVILTYCG